MFDVRSRVSSPYDPAATQRPGATTDLNMPRQYQHFEHRQALFRIACSALDAVTGEIRRQRELLEAYLREHPAFGTSFAPLPPLATAPDVAHRMARAAECVGVGPMAAVAGTMAQLAAEAGLRAGAGEAIVENGGDAFLAVTTPTRVGLYAGSNDKVNSLAFEIPPEMTPLSICSSSGRLGHSASLGCCDLATVVARDAALADAAATFAANQVADAADIDPALKAVMAIEGIAGVLIAHAGRVGLAGNLPPLVRHEPPGD